MPTEDHPQAKAIETQYADTSHPVEVIGRDVAIIHEPEAMDNETLLALDIVRADCYGLIDWLYGGIDGERLLNILDQLINWKIDIGKSDDELVFFCESFKSSCSALDAYLSAQHRSKREELILDKHQIEEIIHQADEFIARLKKNPEPGKPTPRIILYENNNDEIVEYKTIEDDRENNAIVEAEYKMKTGKKMTIRIKPCTAIDSREEQAIRQLFIRSKSINMINKIQLQRAAEFSIADQDHWYICVRDKEGKIIEVKDGESGNGYNAQAEYIKTQTAFKGREGIQVKYEQMRSVSPLIYIMPEREYAWRQTLSHEIRTPLITLTGYIQEMDPRMHNEVENISREEIYSNARMAALRFRAVLNDIQALLDYRVFDIDRLNQPVWTQAHLKQEQTIVAANFLASVYQVVDFFRQNDHSHEYWLIPPQDKQKPIKTGALGGNPWEKMLINLMLNAYIHSRVEMESKDKSVITIVVNQDSQGRPKVIITNELPELIQGQIPEKVQKYLDKLEQVIKTKNRWNRAIRFIGKFTERMGITHIGLIKAQGFGWGLSIADCYAYQNGFKIEQSLNRDERTLATTISYY